MAASSYSRGSLIPNVAPVTMELQAAPIYFDLNQVATKQDIMDIDNQEAPHVTFDLHIVVPADEEVLEQIVVPIADAEANLMALGDGHHEVQGAGEAYLELNDILQNNVEQEDQGQLNDEEQAGT